MMEKCQNFNRKQVILMFQTRTIQIQGVKHERGVHSVDEIFWVQEG